MFDEKERPAIEDDAHMISLMGDCIASMMQEPKVLDALPKETAMACVYFIAIGAARLRIGGQDYDLYQDIALQEVKALTREMKKAHKFAEEERRLKEAGR